MSHKKRIDIILAAGIVVGLISAFFLSSTLETLHRGGNEFEQEELYLRGEKLKGWVLGSEGLLADWYWMSSLQYIGNKILNSKEENINIDNLRPLDPKLLYPMLDNATSLDPQFMAAYSYGATVLPAIDEKKAISIAEKGIAHNPNKWMLYHQLGFIYWKLGDFKSASTTYLKGSGIKGAPGWMKSMAGRMNAEGGSRETARAIYTQLTQTATDDSTRESAKLRLDELDSLEERQFLDQALAEFRDKNGGCPMNWSQLFPFLSNKRLPGGREFRIDVDNNVVDPTDAPYLIDRVTCKSKLDVKMSKLPRK